MLDLLRASDVALSATLDGVDDATLHDASLLPDWTRGHVVSHLARNAEAMLNLVDWARTGVEHQMYPSRQHRAADIEAGAGRSADEQRADLRSTSDRLLAALSTLDDANLTTPLRLTSGREIPAGDIAHVRRVEVEIHHVDLGLGYGVADIPADLVDRLLAERVADLSSREDVPGFTLAASDRVDGWTVGAGGVEVSGTAAALLGWLLGRTEGTDLAHDAPLPRLGAWR